MSTFIESQNNSIYAGLLNRVILDLFTWEINSKLDSIFWLLGGYGKITLEETLQALGFDYNNLKQTLKDRFLFDIDEERKVITEIANYSTNEKDFWNKLKKIYKEKKYKNEYTRFFAPMPNQDHYNPNLFSPNWDYLMSRNEFKYDQIAKVLGCSEPVASKMLANGVFSYKWIQPYRGRPYKVVSRLYLFNFLNSLGFKHLPEMKWKKLPDDDFKIDISKIPDKETLFLKEVADVLGTYKEKIVKLIRDKKFPGGRTINLKTSRITLFVTKKTLLDWIKEYEGRKENES